MNPYRLKDVFNYLTSNNQLLKKKLKLGTDEIPIPPKRSDVTTIEAINRFNKANPRVDTTNLKPLSVKHSNVRQSNVNEPNEGAIQSAFDTATRDAQFEGYPAPSYEKFKSRYLKKNMKADGGRIGLKDGEGVITVDDKIDEMISFYKDYLNQGGKMDFKTFSKKYIPENFAEGGRAGYEDGGMLVKPSDDGSRPGYAKPIKTPTKKELEIAKKVYGSKPEFKNKKYITSFLFKLKSKPAALYQSLGGFAINGVNLTKLQSYPEINSFDSYFFLCDLDGHIEDPKVQKSLEELGLHCEDFHVLGVFEADTLREKK